MTPLLCRTLGFLGIASLAWAIGPIACTSRATQASNNSPSDAHPSPTEPTTMAAPNPAVVVMTFNIRYAGGDKGEHAWHMRRDAVADRIRAANPDILGMQEVVAEQADWLRQQLPQYAFHGVGRIDGVRKGEFAPVMYRADRYELRNSGHFWISETPDVPGSKSWNTACERMASWVRLRDRATTQQLLVINTHLDHVSAEAREHGVAMIRERAEQLSREPDGSRIPVIITGDFNASADGPLSAPLRSSNAADPLALRDAYRVFDPTPDGGEATFNAWTPRTEGDRIDWIFASNTFDVSSVTIDRHLPNGVLPSDHYPVIAALRLVPDAPTK